MTEKMAGGVVEFFAEAARLEGAVPGSNGERLDLLKEKGVISQRQWQILILTDPRRAALEISIIEKLAEKGMAKLDDETFQTVENEGSRYFFENFSPFAKMDFQ